MQNKTMERKLKNAWNNMKTRCTCKTYHAYAEYGGRGISYAKEWESFEKFCEDVGEPSDMKMELDRENTDLGYSKENCRWVTKQINQANRRNWNKNNFPRGVRERKGKFTATITVNGWFYYIGTFCNPDLASVAFLKVFEEWYGFKPQEGR